MILEPSIALGPANAGDELAYPAMWRKASMNCMTRPVSAGHTLART
jgi:hypothetical protein